jgi:hypothetical protein
MYRDYKIVIVIPAGRKRYLEVLIPKILTYASIVDEYRFWINTTNDEDIEYIKHKQQEYALLFTLEHLKVPFNGNNSIYSFFKDCIDEDTIYIRFDDDIVCTDTLDAFKSFLDFRIGHPEYFMVFANILNNSILTNLHQRFGNFSLNHGIVKYDCLDGIGWKNPLFCEKLHEQILNKSLSSFRFNTPWILYDNERISINCISWFGSEFKTFNGMVGEEEEHWLTCIAPSKQGKQNCIFGNFVCVHYAFYTQRPHIDSTDILERYKQYEYSSVSNSHCSS